ncbi:MAG: RNA polymerase sigma factor [bacterium]
MTGGELVLHNITALDEDIEHIKRVQSGDHGSFEPLVEKYRAFVFGVIRSIIFDPIVEEDLAQEAFIQAFRGISRFRYNSKFKTWLYRVTYNVCLNHLRKNSFSKMQDNELDLSSITDESPSPDRKHEKIEIKAVLEKIIKTLPPKFRSILHLYYYEDMQYDEISSMTGLPMGTVKSHLFRAREKVRKMLSDDGWMIGGND